MRKLIVAWREIIHDFSWPVLVLVFVYSAVSAVMTAQNSNSLLFLNRIISLIRTPLCLTIIAILVPRNNISIPVRQPALELLYLATWGIAEAVALAYFWNLVSVNSPSMHGVHYAIIYGPLAFAPLFAVIFRYSAEDLGIPFRHWRLYLLMVALAFPIGKHFVLGERFRMLIGVVSLLVLIILYFSGAKRWRTLADDWKILRPYLIPIALCALVTFGLDWACYRHQVPWELPFRGFNTYSMIQGAIPEESYCRLGLQTRLARLVPFGWASLLQSIAFAALHIPGMLAEGWAVNDIPWSFATGIANAVAVGYFWRRSRNLPAAILFHMAVFT